MPSSSAKLKSSVNAGPTSDIDAFSGGAARFPPENKKLTEQELDPYFVNFEASIKQLEQLLMGPIEKVNRRTLSHLSSLAADLCELGSKYNAFALSEEKSETLGAAIEKIGQAADSSYIATEELSSQLGAIFAEPMRENAQFAGVVRGVLRYRVLKRVQQEMTNEELGKKKALLDQLEHSESEARRIEQYLSGSQHLHQPPPRGAREHTRGQRDGSQDDADSFDSDFPPAQGVSNVPSAKQGAPAAAHRRIPSGNSITNKIFGPIRHVIQGVADVDPERSRRDLIGKTREGIGQLEQAKVAVERDVKDASASTLMDLKRFQGEKEDDLRRYMVGVPFLFLRPFPSTPFHTCQFY
ncbi:hypothetical protein IMZ48_03120 [Candidatus Bathyarchaeota archaeon]|nr:hypothetical protein [Candidatus Bathyarchaeota archaeon]